MSNESTAEKGKRFELFVQNGLIKCGLQATRTNKTNEHDLVNYKHGFDGGIDIIATYSFNDESAKDYVFFIQCKCQESKLDKTAICEASTGMRVRQGYYTDNCLPVVITKAEATEETRKFAKDAGVELITGTEFEILNKSLTNKNIYVKDYGVLLSILLYHNTKNEYWLRKIPKIKFDPEKISETDKLSDYYNSCFDLAQIKIDRSIEYEIKAQNERQQALDIMRANVYSCLQYAKIAKHGNNNTKPGDKELQEIKAGPD